MISASSYESEYVVTNSKLASFFAKSATSERTQPFGLITNSSNVPQGNRMEIESAMFFNSKGRDSAAAITNTTFDSPPFEGFFIIFLDISNKFSFTGSIPIKRVFGLLIASLYMFLPSPVPKSICTRSNRLIISVNSSFDKSTVFVPLSINKTSLPFF